MNNLKKNRAIALKKVGINKKEINDYLKSSREYFVQYRGRDSKLITPTILEKMGVLADVRREMGIEIAGVIFENNLRVTFLFYVDGNPEDAWFERNDFLDAEDFEEELERQIASNFIPDMKRKQVFYKYGTEVDLIIF